MSRGKNFDKDEYGRYKEYCPACKCITPRIKGMCLPCKSRTEQTAIHVQLWKCTQCETKGSCIYMEGEPARNVLDRIIAEHRNNTVLCPGALDKLWIYEDEKDVIS